MRLLSILLALALALGCRERGGTEPTPATPTTKPAPAVTPAPAARAQVRVDRRVELVAVIERLAGAREYATVSGTGYLEAVDAHFAPYREHAAVVAARQLRADHGIGFDAPMSFAVHLDDQLALVPAAARATLDPRWAKADPEAFAAAVRAFAADTKFEAFFASQAPYFARLEAPLRELLDREPILAWFERLFGPTPMTMLVIPSPIAGQRNFGPRAPGTFVQILGVSSPRGDLRVTNSLRALLVHELAHAFVNPLFAEHRAALEPAGQRLFASVAAAMRAQAYPDALTLVNESGVRALAYNYLREVHGEAAAGSTLRDDLRQSFAWTKGLAEVMQPGPTLLPARMPAIAERFTALAAQYEHGAPPPGFLGPVDAVHTPDSVWVVPAGIASESYVRAAHAKLGKRNAIVAAEPPAARDLVAFGTPAENPVIADIAKRAGWVIEPGRITIGTRELTGENLVLIACWPRAGDPAHGVAVYTAARADDVVGILGIRHGDSDWLVARAHDGTLDILGAGDFVHGDGGAWTAP